MDPAFASFIVSPLACAETEGAMKTLQSIKQDKADIEELNSIMRSMDLNLSSQEIHDMLQYVPKNGKYVQKN